VRVLRNRDLHVPAGSSTAAFPRVYGEFVAQIELGSLEILNGSLPPRALRLVREWARLHPDELAENWALAQALEPLVPIDPLA
jgi:Domain of unknown function (DUF4160)